MRKARRSVSATRPYQTLALAAGTVLLAFALIGMIGWNAASGAPVLARWLEDATGETELLPQIKNFAGLVRYGRSIETADMAPVAATSGVPYGANAFFEQEVEEGKIRRTMEMMRGAGIRWVRQEVPWELIEPVAKGRFVNAYGSTWQQFDRIVSLAREYGLELVLRPDLPPPWARSNPKVPQSRPRDLADYGDFVEALARRYQGQVRYYQIWNEPNLYAEWGDVPDAAGYAEMLRTAHERLKAVDPAITILSAPLSPTLGTPDGLNESELTYLQKLYDLGAWRHFDILSAQGYGLWSGPGNRRTEESQVNFSRPRLLREIMVRNGDAGKPVWISEMGWNALPPDFSGPATHGRVTLDQQARYTADGLRRIQRDWPWVGVTFVWHFRRVSDDDRNQTMFYYRMVDPDFTPLPVYHAVKQLATATPLMRRGFHQEDDWTLTWQGGWTGRTRADAALGMFRSPDAPGASLEWSVEGTEIAVAVTAAPAGGQFYVTVDGEAADGDLRHDARGRAILAAAATIPAVPQVIIARGLSDGPHRIRLEADRGGSDWGIDGIIVERRDGFNPLFLLAIPLAGFGSAVLGFMLGRRNYRPQPAARRRP